MKEFYIAPEVEIVCFAPIERLATDFWNTWGGTSLYSDSGEDGSNSHITVPNETDPDTDGEK